MKSADLCLCRGLYHRHRETMTPTFYGLTSTFDGSTCIWIGLIQQMKWTRALYFTNNKNQYQNQNQNKTTPSKKKQNTKNKTAEQQYIIIFHIML